MISLDYIRNFFPKQIGENPAFDKQMLKEYLQLLILDFISSSVFSTKIVFIGGTNLRLIKNIDRFSEDVTHQITIIPTPKLLIERFSLIR